MADWHDIKKAFERDAQKAENKFVENEQRLLKSIATYLGSDKGVSAVQNYTPDDVLAFLSKAPSEIKQLLGEDWLSVPDDKLDTLIYSLSKKVKLSGNIIEW